MKRNLRSTGSVLLGIGILIGFVVLVLFFFRGGLWLNEVVYPWLSLVSATTFLACLLIVLPLALIRRTRGLAGLGLFIASYLFGVSLWVWAFLLTYTLWGRMALFIGLLLVGTGLVPIAMLATVFNGEWARLENLSCLPLSLSGQEGSDSAKVNKRKKLCLLPWEQGRIIQGENWSRSGTECCREAFIEREWIR